MLADLSEFYGGLSASFPYPHIYIKRASNSLFVNNEDLLERITINSKIMVGKPVIRGTRLTVEYILGLLAHGISMEAILEEYPGLVKDDIFACLLFASKTLQEASFVPVSYTHLDVYKRQGSGRRAGYREAEGGPGGGEGGDPGRGLIFFSLFLKFFIPL